MSEGFKQLSFDDLVGQEEKPIEEEMSERERIEFIREHGTEEMRDGLGSVFQRNKFKPMREEMWEEQLFRGKKMVRSILDKREELEEEVGDDDEKTFKE